MEPKGSLPSQIPILSQIHPVHTLLPYAVGVFIPTNERQDTVHMKMRKEYKVLFRKSRLGDLDVGGGITLKRRCEMDSTGF
jgi:hypothetical protein